MCVSETPDIVLHQFDLCPSAVFESKDMDTLAYSTHRSMNIEDKLTDKVKMRVAVQFAVQLGESTGDIIRMVQRVYGLQGCSARTVRRWCAKFWTTPNHRITDAPRSGRPRMQRVAQVTARVQNVIQNDRTRTVRQIEDELHISRSSVHRILKKDLNLTKKCAKIVPHCLNPAQRNNRQRICTDWLRAFGRGADRRIVTMDETYVHFYDPKTKRQSMEWLPPGTNRPQKVRHERTVRKLLLVVFWDSRGVIYR